MENDNSVYVALVNTVMCLHLIGNPKVWYLRNCI